MIARARFTSAHLSFALVALPLLAACDMGGGTGDLPQSARLTGNDLTLDFGGRRCAISAPAGTSLDQSFSVVAPQNCPGVVEVAVARFSGPSAHVVQIVPAALGPLVVSGQHPGLTGIEVTVMAVGGRVGGYVGG